jgi:preprotein translocase subunit SecE
MADKIKVAFAVLAVIAGIAGFYYLAESPAIVRVACVLGGVLVAAIVAWQTEPGKNFVAFAQESVTEAKKVVWPTRKETVQTTGIVLLFVLTTAIFLWVVDAGLLWGVKLLMGRAE